MLVVWLKKTDFNTKVTEIEGKIPNVSNLVKKTDFNTKVTEIQGKIPDVSNLVKNTDFDTTITHKISETNSSFHVKYNEPREKFPFCFPRVFCQY